MSIVLDTNMKLFAERMNITSSRMIQDYGLKTVDEIIEAEAERGNTQAVKYAREMYNSPEKLIKIFKLTDVENKFVLLHNMDDTTRQMILPLLEKDDLVMGLYFFTQEKLLSMLAEVDIEELVNVVLGAFPLDQIIMMFTEDDLANFFQHRELDKNDVIEQMKAMPPEVMIKFVEGVTGRPSEETNPLDLIKSIENLPIDKYRDFMSAIDPDVQRQLTFQLTKQKPEYLLEKIVLASTEEGQVILDPFCGSGTTGVEAVRFGRKFIGIDVSEEYLEISKRRLEKVTNEK